MSRFKGHTQDPEPAINSSYFVEVAGHKALTIMSHQRNPNFSPPMPIPDVPTFMVDNKLYSKAAKGKLITADLSLECVEDENGDNYCRELDKRFRKVNFLLPKILNPRNIRHFLPNGDIVSDPVFQDDLPDREIKIPITLIEITDRTDIMLSVLPPVATQTPPDDCPRPPAPFTIYTDPPASAVTPSDSAPTSPASTISMSTSDASSLFEAGNIQTSKGLTMILRPRDKETGNNFEPMSTSTKSPEKKNIYDNPTPGPSSETDRASLTHPQPGNRKTPRKSPRKELKRTASQPAIDEYIRHPSSRQPRLPSPIPRNLATGGKRPRSPASPEERNAAKYKKILSDLSTEDREVTRSLEDALMHDDPAIKEATVNPETVRELYSRVVDRLSSQASSATDMSTSSSSSSIPPKSSIDLNDTPQENIDHVIPFDPAREVSEDTGNLNRNPSLPVRPEDARTSSDDTSLRSHAVPSVQEGARYPSRDPPPPDMRPVRVVDARARSIESSEGARLSHDRSPPPFRAVQSCQEDAENSLSNLPLPDAEPNESPNSSEEIPPPSQGTSNELGKFDNDNQQTPSQSPSPPIVVQVGNEQSSNEQVLAFNLLNAEVANANLDGAARPRRGPPTPEHVLVSIDMDGNISRILHFHEQHDPEDILEAYWNNTINSAAPDEGFDSTADVTPAAPPPSSNEASFGSSNPPLITLSDNSIEILDDSNMDTSDVPNNLHLMSQNVTIDISDSIEEEKEEEEEGEKEEEKE